jgi:hypothetical protein
LQDSLTDILKGDASDATPRLGADVCPLFNQLMWAREVQKVFSNGVETTVLQLRRHLKEIGELPNVGATGDLISKTATLRLEASELVKREDFFTKIPSLQTVLKGLQIAVVQGVKALATAQTLSLNREVVAIQSMLEWGRLGAENQAAFSNRFDRLQIKVSEDLDGIRKLLNHQFTISVELERIRAEIGGLTKPRGNGRRRKSSTEISIALPEEFTSIEDVDAVVAELEEVRRQLSEYERVKIKWK